MSQTMHIKGATMTAPGQQTLSVLDNWWNEGSTNIYENSLFSLQGRVSADDEDDNNHFSASVNYLDPIAPEYKSSRNISVMNVMSSNDLEMYGYAYYDIVPYDVMENSYIFMQRGNRSLDEGVITLDHIEDITIHQNIAFTRITNFSNHNIFFDSRYNEEWCYQTRFPTANHIYRVYFTIEQMDECETDLYVTAPVQFKTRRKAYIVDTANAVSFIKYPGDYGSQISVDIWRLSRNFPCNYEYSYDKTTWYPLDMSSSQTLTSSGSIHIRASKENFNANIRFSRIAGAHVAVYGNINSLLNKTNYIRFTKLYTRGCFDHLLSPANGSTLECARWLQLSSSEIS